VTLQQRHLMNQLRSTPPPLPHHSAVRAARSRQQLQIALVAAGLISIALVLALILASAVASAPFRMLAQTEFVGFKAKDDARLSFEVVDWELRALRLSGATDNTPVSITRPGESGTTSVDRADFWLHDGDEVTLQRLPDRFGRPRFALSFPNRSVPVGMQLAQSASQPIQVTSQSKPPALNSGSPLRGEVGGLADAALVFGIARTAIQTRPRVAVSTIGFGRPSEDGRVRAGLQTGSLVFLDKPDTEVRLWKGTDLRLRGIDAELASLALSEDGIEVHVDGLTSDATMHVGTSAQSHQMRRVMPTYYDKLKGEPTMAVLVGFAAVMSTFGGLLLSAAQISNRLAARIRRIGGE
jgi:hypothetical protein